jgi:ABC-2 type transport system permease protein/lipopolysaccharide transport system permease protein
MTADNASMSELIETKTSRHKFRPLEAVQDLIDGLARWELWSTHGWNDIRQRYRRSVVGPFWLTISMGLMVGGLAYLYAGLFGQSIETYLPYVAVGMIVFNMISAIAVDGSYAFISSSRIILQTKTPLSVYVYQMLWRNILIFAHNMCIYLVLIVVPVFKTNLGFVTLLALPGLFLLLLNGVWISLILGGLSARFRDVPPIIASIVQIAFFLTPVFWTPGALKGREIFVHLNPFYYLLEVVRMPLLGQAPSMTIWLVVIAINCASAAVAIMFYARYRARIPYWV